MNHTPSSSYDPIAELYHARWVDWYHPAALPAMERLFFSKIPSGAHVLDLCCGSGHMSQVLVNRGYQVTGIDSSPQMIALAQGSLPQAEFLVQDARDFQFDRHFSAVVSTFDSLNHITELADLEKVFRNVHRVLSPGALLFFDMNLEEAYLNDWIRWSAHVSERDVHLIKGTYDPLTKAALTKIIWFSPAPDNELWIRRETEVLERCYTPEEITEVLEKTGFQQIETFPASLVGVIGEIALGRMFFRARAR